MKIKEFFMLYYNNINNNLCLNNQLIYKKSTTKWSRGGFPVECNIQYFLYLLFH
jgi:hypothetical protein